MLNKQYNSQPDNDKSEIFATKGLNFAKSFILKHLFPKLDNSIDMKTIQTLSKTHALVFVLTSGGMFEKWYLEHLLNVNDICEISFVNRRGIFPHIMSNNLFVKIVVRLLQNIKGAPFVNEDLLAEFATNLRNKKHSILFYDQDEYRSVRRLGYHEKYLEVMLDNYRRNAVPVKIIPIVFLWRRAHLSQRSLFNLFFGSSAHPGIIRKIIFFFIRDRLGFVKDTKHIDIYDYSIEAPFNQNLKTYVRQLRRLILTSLTNELKIILGPAYHTPSMMVDHVLSDQEFMSIISRMSVEEGKSLEALQEEAALNLKDIASDYNFYVLEFLTKLGTFFARNIYERIIYDKKEFEKLKELSSKYPVLFTPSHKSHIDYCLLTIIFFWEKHAPPRVAAGRNLNFWPVGPLLRKCGAFYIRRTFKGDKLYSECIRAYIEYLLKFKYNQEFFIEGGRSRTGKLCYPKYGLLKYYVNAVSRGVVEDLYICPMAISYDTVAESSSYSQEQSGVKKKKESLIGLINVQKILRKRYGCAYVSFGNHFSLKNYMAASGEDYARADAETQRHFIKKLAFRIMREIDKVTIVTPVTLASTVVLTSKTPGLYIEDLRDRMYKTFEYVKSKNLHYSDQFDADFDEAFYYSLEKLTKQKHLVLNYIQGMDKPDERVYYVDQNERLNTNYYKNSIINYFVPRAIAILSLKICVKDNVLNSQYFWENVNFIKTIMKYEFFFSSDTSFKAEILNELTPYFKDQLSLSENNVFTKESLSQNVLEIENRDLLPFYESYYTVARVLEKLNKSSDMKELMLKTKLMFEKLLWTGEVSLHESHSHINYSNAIMLFESMSVLEKVGQTIYVKNDENSKGTLNFVRGNLRKFILLNN